MSIFGIAVVAVLLSVAFLGHAQEANTARGVSISPLTFEFRLDPGEVVSDVVRVFNGGSEPLVVSLKLEDVTATGERGQALIEEAETTSYSITSWTTMDTNALVLDPGEQRAVNFTITVPENAEPGGHYGAFTVEVGPGDLTSGGSGIGIAQKVAALMLVAVSGDVDESVTLTDFFISTEKTKFKYDWIPTNWILDPKEITFVLRFENTGSVHEKPAGRITVTNALNNQLAQIPLEQRNILPDTARVIEMTWEPDGLTFGKIRAQVDAIYGTKNEPLFAAAEFWIVPVSTLGPWVIGIFFALLFMLIFRKRLKLALGIMIRGDKAAAGKEKDKTPPSAPAQPPTQPNAPKPPQGGEGQRPTVT